MASGTSAVTKNEVSAGVACAMRDLRFVATELKQLQSEELLPQDTAEKVVPKLAYDSARQALGLPADANGGAATAAALEDHADRGGVVSLVNASSYSAGGIGLCLFSVAMLIGLEIANFVVMEVPPPIIWAVLLLLLSSAPLTHAAGTELHDSYKFCQPLQGGNTFVLLQGFGWTIYGFICLLVLWEALSTNVLCPVRSSLPHDCLVADATPSSQELNPSRVCALQLFKLCQFKTLVSLHVSSGTPGLLFGISIGGLIVQLLLLASLQYYKQRQSSPAPRASIGSIGSSTDPDDVQAVAVKPRMAETASPSAPKVKLAGTQLYFVRLANFLVCQNGLAHMFECPLTWWRPPRNFDLEHSMQYMFDPISQWIALAILWPLLKHTASGKRALFGLAIVGSGHVLSIWGQYLSFGGVTATHNFNVFYTLMDTVNLLYCGFVIAEHKLLVASDIVSTYMLALGSFFLLIHLDFVDFLSLLTSIQDRADELALLQP